MANNGFLVYMCASVLTFASLPLYTKSFEDPTDFNKTAMWINPCEPEDVSSLGPPTNDTLEQRKIFLKVGRQSAGTLLQMYDLWSQWVELKLSITKWYGNTALQIMFTRDNYLPTYTMTSKVLYGPIKSVKYDERLQLFPNLYEWLQRVSVGMEELVHDQFLHEDKYRVRFAEGYRNLKKVLCEMDSAMYRLDMTKKPDIDRGIMGQSERSITDSDTRLIRDVGIFREYINMLEYVYQLTEAYAKYLLNKSIRHDYLKDKLHPFAAVPPPRVG